MSVANLEIHFLTFSEDSLQIHIVQYNLALRGVLSQTLQVHQYTDCNEHRLVTNISHKVPEKKRPQRRENQTSSKKTKKQ
jgi:hypothetical protein